MTDGQLAASTQALKNALTQLPILWLHAIIVLLQLICWTYNGTLLKTPNFNNMDYDVTCTLASPLSTNTTG